MTELRFSGGPYDGKVSHLRSMAKHGDTTLPFRTRTHPEPGQYRLDCGDTYESWKNARLVWQPMGKGWLAAAIDDALQAMEGWP